MAALRNTHQLSPELAASYIMSVPIIAAIGPGSECAPKADNTEAAVASKMPVIEGSQFVVASMESCGPDRPALTSISKHVCCSYNCIMNSYEFLCVLCFFA